MWGVIPCLVVFYFILYNIFDTMTIGQGVLFTLVMLIGVTLTHIHTLYFYVDCIRQYDISKRYHTHAHAYAHAYAYTHAYTCIYIYPTEKRQKN